MQADIKRLFFGWEVHAPWPHHLPKGRLIDEKHRHLTLAFLGNIAYSSFRELLCQFPKVFFKIGPVGYFDSCLILPPQHPRVVAWHAIWLNNSDLILGFQKTLSNWLTFHGYCLDKRSWKPHVTLCRQPFDAHIWLKSFISIPFYASSIHLYQSTGNLCYVPIWSYPIKAPFEEINHTADIAFIIHGENLHQLYYNAFIALAFKFPEFIPFFTQSTTLNHLDDIIIALNNIISCLDRSIGSPLKAISFHGKIISSPDTLLQWEMIIDV